MPEQPYDSGDPRAVRERTRDTKRAGDRRQETLRLILSHENGRDWLYSLLELCGVYQTPFSSDIAIMSHNIGRQDVGRKLLADIVAADSRMYMKMLQEKEEDDGRRSSTSTNGSGDLDAAGDLSSNPDT